MLVRARNVFGDAMGRGYAVVGVRPTDVAAARGFVAVAEGERSPVVLEVPEGLTREVVGVAETATVPVIVHVRGEGDMAVVKQGIDAGGTAVAVDVSGLSKAEGRALVEQIVQYAHDRGVWVDAVVGDVDVAAAGGDQMEGLEVDGVAVSLATVSGAFTGRRYARLDVLDELAAQAGGRPLAVDGVFDVAPSQLRWIGRGATCKVVADGGGSEEVAECMRLLGSAGRA